VREAFLGTCGIQFHPAAFTDNRDNARNAKLGSFLHDQIHFLAARNALHQP